MLHKQDGCLDWMMPAPAIHNRVRGFLPWPGCFTRLRGQAFNIWRAREAGPGAGQPGSLHPRKGGLFVTCGASTSLELVEVQVEGRKRMPAGAFLNGFQVEDNELLEMSQ